MSRLWAVAGVAMGLVAWGYAPEASAIKVQRDPSVSAVPQPPKAAPPAPAPAPDLPKLTAAQVADRNVEARGGLAAWHAIQSMTLKGRLDAGGKQDTYLPYTLQIKRPDKQRLAIEFAGQTSLQVYDGTRGWKLRPYLNRADAEPFSPEELQKVRQGPGLEGFLIDYAARGSQVELEGTETVDGKATYRLKVTSKDRSTTHIWVDGTTFLEVKVEDPPRRFDGRVRPVDTYLSDYRTIQGVVIPFMSETRVEGAHFAHKMTVESAVMNAKLDDALFARPAPAVLPPQRIFTMAPTPNAPKP